MSEVKRSPFDQPAQRYGKHTFSDFYLRVLDEAAMRLTWAYHSMDRGESVEVIRGFQSEIAGMAIAIEHAGYQRREFEQRVNFRAAKRYADVYTDPRRLNDLIRIYGEDKVMAA